MTIPRPLASLSSGLLARKGAAKPAMRPHGFGLTGGATPAALDDLGWNDMGSAEAAPVSAPPPAPVTVHPATPTPVEQAVDAMADADDELGAIPPVLVEREALAEAIEAPAAVRGVSLATAARLRRETQHAGKAALTLRLDANRHLRLRLASAISNQSAQQLLTQALDALVTSMPTVEALVAQLPAAKPRKAGNR